MTGEIRLEGLTFRAYHGVHDFERRDGNDFEVNLTVLADLTRPSITDDLAHTLDYEQLYTIVRDEMTVPANLLEHVARRIHDRIQQEFPAVIKLSVNIAKLNPQIGGPCRRTAVTLTSTSEANS